MISVEIKPFSGPMDLLLDLIDKSKIDIYDIEISVITEQFVQAMQELPFSSEELTDFIRMASILVMIKARSLLADQEDDEDEEVTREELIARLVEYQRFKSVTAFFRSREDAADGFFAKPPEELANYLPEEVEEEIIGEAGLLKMILQELLTRPVDVEEEDFRVDRIINIEEYSLERMEERIREKLISGKRFTLADLLDDCPSKPQVITVFLSLLELTRSHELRLTQEGSSIWIDCEGETNE